MHNEYFYHNEPHNDAPSVSVCNWTTNMVVQSVSEGGSPAFYEKLQPDFLPITSLAAIPQHAAANDACLYADQPGDADAL